MSQWNFSTRRLKNVVKILRANTLTVRNGRRALPKELLRAKRLDNVEGDEEVGGLIDDLLFSPVRRQVLCGQVIFGIEMSSVSG